MDCHNPVSGTIHPILLFIQSHIVAQHVCDIQPGYSSVDKKMVHGNVRHRIRLLIFDTDLVQQTCENRQRANKTNFRYFIIVHLQKMYFVQHTPNCIYFL